MTTIFRGAVDRDKQVINALEDLDNSIFNQGDCTVILWFGTGDDGERYVDAQVLQGLIEPIMNRVSLAEVTSSDDMFTALVELNEDLV